jgi:Holliday junction resolvase
MNRNYMIGYRFEMRVVKYFLKYGFYVIRSPKSKGLYDLVAIPPLIDKSSYNFPYLIQCKKNGYVKPEEMKRLLEYKNKWQSNNLIAWSDKKTRRLKMRDLDGVEMSLGAIESLGTPMIPQVIK